MKLTKYDQACVVVESGHSSLVVDPGTLTRKTDVILASVDAVLITHEHPDHCDGAAIAAALAKRDDLKVFASAAIAAQLPPGSVTVVRNGDEFYVGDISVRVLGTTHAPTHPDLPAVENLGFLIAGQVLHPGDSYLVPGVPVDTLLVPTSGPWTKVSEAVEYIRTVRPRRSVQIHEMMLTALGQKFAADLLGVDGLTQSPFVVLEPGESIEIP